MCWQCEHQKENFAKEDFLLQNWPIYKIQQLTRKIPPGLFFSSDQCPRGSGVPHPVISGLCGLPAQDHPQGVCGLLVVLGMVWCPARLCWQPLRGISAACKCECLEGNIQIGLLVPAAKHCGSVCQHLRVPVKQFLSKPVLSTFLFKDKCTFLLSKNHLKLFKIWVLFCLSFAEKMYITHHLYKAKMNTFSQTEV